MYTNDQLRTFCEIGFLKHLPDLVKNYHKNSKFGGFLTSLEKECHKIQKRILPTYTIGDMNAASHKLNEFGKITNWNGNQLSPNRMFCFCSRMLSESKHLKHGFDKVTEIMMRLIDYQESRGYITPEHYEDGDWAYTKWLACWGEVDTDEYNQEESQKTLEKTGADVERNNLFEEYKEKMYGK